MYWRKYLPHTGLLLLLVLTTLAPLWFVQLNEATGTWNFWKLLAKTGSLCAVVLMVWQFLLGYRHAAARWVGGDYLWTVTVHKWVGVAAGTIIFLHPVFIGLLYAKARGLNLFSFNLPSPLLFFAWLGIAALVVLVFLVVSSVKGRRHLGRGGWYLSHLLSYVLLPAALVHGYAIGDTLGETGLRYGWQGLFVVVGVFYVLRGLGGLGVFSAQYEVTEVEHVTHDVNEINLSPLGRPLRPRPGQFAFFRRGRFGRTRPFTVSRYSRDDGSLGITVKALGEVSRELQNVQVGERFLVDGPFGVFGREALVTERPIVLLAAGIGITPFRRLIQEFDELPTREVFLFYGNQYEKDIAHRREIEAASYVDLVHVLSGVEEHGTFAVGNITTSLLKRHLDQPLPTYEFFICGPPGMIKSLEKNLYREHVPRRQVHHELFDY